MRAGSGSNAKNKSTQQQVPKRPSGWQAHRERKEAQLKALQESVKKGLLLEAELVQVKKQLAHAQAEVQQAQAREAQTKSELTHAKQQLLQREAAAKAAHIQQERQKFSQLVQTATSSVNKPASKSLAADLAAKLFD